MVQFVEHIIAVSFFGSAGVAIYPEHAKEFALIAAAGTYTKTALSCAEGEPYPRVTARMQNANNFPSRDCKLPVPR